MEPGPGKGAAMSEFVTVLMLIGGFAVAWSLLNRWRDKRGSSSGDGDGTGISWSSGDSGGSDSGGGDGGGD